MMMKTEIQVSFKQSAICDEARTAIRMPNPKSEYLSNSDLLCLEPVCNYAETVKWNPDTPMFEESFLATKKSQRGSILPHHSEQSF